MTSVKAKKKLDAAFGSSFAISLTRFGHVIGFERSSLILHVKAGTLRTVSRGKHLFVTREMADDFLSKGGMTDPQLAEKNQRTATK
jgi:hypothetical protein